MSCLTRICIVALACILCGCATPQTPEVDSPSTWHLSPTARSDYLFLKAQALLAEGNATAATTALANAVEIDPQPELYLELAQTYWKNAYTQQAKATLKEGIDRFPNQFAFVDTLSQIYTATERPQAAKATLQTYIHAHPEHWRARAKLGKIQIQGSNFAAAVDTLQAIPATQRSPKHLLLLGQAQLGLGALQKAESHLQEAVQRSPKTAEAWAELGYVRERQKDYPAAIDAYTELYALQPHNREVVLRLIELHLELNNPDKAQDLALNGPEKESFRLRCVDIFLQAEFYTQAKALLDALQAQESPSPKVYLYQALYSYQKEKNPAQAIEYLQQIPSSRPFYDQALHFQGQMHLEREEYANAIALAQQGQEAFPEAPQFWQLHSTALRKQGQSKQALHILDSALDKWPENTDILYQKGVLAESMGQTQTAIETMEKIISLNPEHADALNFVGYSLAEQGQNLDRALVLIQNAVELKPDNGYILDSLAWVHYRRHDYDKAWQVIQKAVDKRHDDPTIWEHYGDIARQIQKIDHARQAYQKALDLGTQNRAQIKDKLHSLPGAAPL